MANTFIERDPLSFNKILFLDIYMAGHNGYIAGGCFKNIFQGVKIKDIDIFFNSETDFAQANIYFKSNADYLPSYENDNTIAYKNTKTNIRVELIKKEYGTPAEILARFDFSITKFAYLKRKTETETIMGLPEIATSYHCLHHEFFFEHLTCKKLVLEPAILFPVSTWERSYRYNKYGFGLCRESKENLLNALKNADVSNLSQSLYFGID